MTDISMCTNKTCPMRCNCHRNPASGTIADPVWQTWTTFRWKMVGPRFPQDVLCEDFMPKKLDYLQGPSHDQP